MEIQETIVVPNLDRIDTPMKLPVLVVVALFFVGVRTANAQVAYVPPTARPYTIGLSAGLTQMYTNDLREYRPLRPAAKVNFDYNLRYFVTVGLEYQYGVMETGDREAGSVSEGLGAKNRFISGNANFKVSAGQFTNSYNNVWVRTLNGLYAGAGLGVILNNMSGLVTTLPGAQKKPVRFYKNNSQAITIPLNLGWNFILPRVGKYSNLALNINYQYSYAFGDYLDGYNLILRGNARGGEQRKDKYTFMSIGLRYTFGRWR